MEVSDHDRRDQRCQCPCTIALLIPDPFAYCAELASEGEALGDRVRCDDGGCAAVECVGERRRVSGAAGQLDRLSA